MEKLGYQITILENETFDEIMSQVVFTREEAQRLIDNTRDIPGMFPMVIEGMYQTCG
jgi:hypothetical protein